MPSREQDQKQPSEPALRLIASHDAILQCYAPRTTFLLCYVLTNIVLFFFGAVEEHRSRGDDHFLAWTIGLARGFGSTLNLNLAMIIVLSARKILTCLRRTALGSLIPIDEAMPGLHALIGQVAFAASILHTFFHCLGGLVRGLWQPGYGNWTQLFVTGVVLLIIFFAIFVTALRPVRSKNYELFSYVHVIGITPFMPLLFFHGFHKGTPSTFKWIMGPVSLYVIDRILRKISENVASVTVNVGSECSHLVYDGGIGTSCHENPSHLFSTFRLFANCVLVLSIPSSLRYLLLHYQFEYPSRNRFLIGRGNMPNFVFPLFPISGIVRSPNICFNLLRALFAISQFPVRTIRNRQTAFNNIQSLQFLVHNATAAFTMASAPHEKNMIFFIKNSGDWTSTLYDLCKTGLHPRTRAKVESFEILVRGPHGAPAQHYGQYDKILLISGGVGATPFCR